MDNNFEIAIKTVRTRNDNTTLRMKNVNTDFSSDYKDTIVGNSKPVVLARGLWENLLSWNDFGKELAFDEYNARDTWLIELTGGLTTECESCPNYEYEDLTDYYWPALIAGVEYYSGKNQVDYVGFSNGCRVALDSLKNWSSTGKNNAGYCFNSQTGLYDIDCDLASEPINTFIAVGCPGAFEGNSPVAQVISDFGDSIQQKLSGKTHVSSTEMGQALLEQCGKYHPIFDFIKKQSCLRSAQNFAGESKISFNLAMKYKTFIESDDDNQPGNMTVKNFKLVYGKLPFWSNVFAPGNSDGIVTVADASGINNQVTTTSTKGDIKPIKGVFHISVNKEESLPDTSKTKKEIKDFLNEVN